MQLRDLDSGASAFSQAAQRIVSYLNTHTPLTDWSVSRVAGGEQVHVHVHHVDVIEVGQRVEWSSSFCRHMMNGAARVVADSHLDPDYAHLPDASDVRAYAACPITDDDGSTFGVLCGVSRVPLAHTSDVDADLVALMGDLLSAQLGTARAAGPHDRVARYGGDEFSILTTGVAAAHLGDHFARFADALQAAGVGASLGYCLAGPGPQSLLDAFAEADSTMYAAKRAKAQPV